MAIISFVIFMGILIKLKTERWWLGWLMIMGVAAHCGVKFGVIGIAVSMGISQVLKDICRAK